MTALWCLVAMDFVLLIWIIYRDSLQINMRGNEDILRENFKQMQKERNFYQESFEMLLRKTSGGSPGGKGSMQPGEQ